MIDKKCIALFLLAVALLACTKLPLGGRGGQLFVPNYQEIKHESGIAYDKFLRDPRTKIISDSPEAQHVKNVGMRLADAINKYIKSNGYSDTYNYSYEFNLVEKENIETWCMPSGKVAIYMGILPLIKDDNDLATILAHEMGHAIAGHSERIVNSVISLAEAKDFQRKFEAEQRKRLHKGKYNLVDSLLSIFYEKKETPYVKVTIPKVLRELYGLDSGIILLEYDSRSEKKADRIGLSIMAIAGYDPKKAVEFWQRMATLKTTPQFLITHPSAIDKRIFWIKKYLPEALNRMRNETNSDK